MAIKKSYSDFEGKTFKLEKVKAINSISEAVNLFSQIKINIDIVNLFRGQTNAEWELIPSIFRTGKGGNYHHSEREHNLVKDMLSDQTNSFLNDYFLIDKLARMAHYGLPTRLLDVTQNFLVALYFACEKSSNDDKDGAIFTMKAFKKDNIEKHFESDTLSILSNLSLLDYKDKEKLWNYVEIKHDDTKIGIKHFNNEEEAKKLVQFIRLDNKSYFDNRIVPSSLIKAKYYSARLNNPRIIAQSGGFLVFGLYENDRFDKYPLIDFEIKKYVIPSSVKEKIRRQLAVMGINKKLLFPEIDKAADYFKEIYQNPNALEL